jgi:hypothetical protein
VRSSLGNVDQEKGQRWSLVVARTWWPKRSSPSTGALRSRRAAAARALVDLGPERGRLLAAEPHRAFANFYFGAFGNNYVDHKDEQRYREYQSLPGLEINEAAAATS